MDHVPRDVVAPMEGMENIPIVLGFNGSRSCARAVALIILVAGILVLNGDSYARFVIMEQPFVFVAGWKTVLGYFGVGALSGLSYWWIVRQSMDVFPGGFSLSGANSEAFAFDKIYNINVVRDLRGRVHMVALKAERVKVWLLVGGFDGMDALSETLVHAVKEVNPWVSVCQKKRPHLILTGMCCFVSVLLGFYYLWIAVRLPSHVAPLLPLFPAFLLVCAQTAFMVVFQWSLAGYGMAFIFLMLPVQLVIFQMSILVIALIAPQALGGGCGC